MAEEAFRDGLNNNAYWRGVHEIKATENWPPRFKAYIGHALYQQGKVEASCRAFREAEPHFARLISEIDTLKSHFDTADPTAKKLLVRDLA